MMCISEEYMNKWSIKDWLDHRQTSRAHHRGRRDQGSIHSSWIFLSLLGPNCTRGQSVFSGVKKIKICRCDQKPSAIAFFDETKICSAPNKVQRGRRLPLKQAKLIQILIMKNKRRMLWGKGFVSGRFRRQFVLKILKTISWLSFSAIRP